MMLVLLPAGLAQRLLLSLAFLVPGHGHAATQETAPRSTVQQTAQENPDTDPPLPPARTTYMGRTIAATMSHHAAAWLTRESREREENSRRMLECLELKEGQVVCDLGCGNGFHTVPMARAVGATGKVYAVDIQPEMLALLDQATTAAEVTDRVVPVLGTVADPKLPPDSQDLILLVDVYHEFSHPELMLRAIHRALKPTGRVVLVEFRQEDPDVPIKEEHKMSKAQIQKELEANGFRLARAFDELPWQHVMFFQRASEPPDAPEDGR